MEQESVGFSQEKLNNFEEEAKKFKDALTEEEIRLLTHIHLHGGLEEDKLPNQDEQERAAKEKLRNAGFDADNYGKYIEFTK